MQPSSNLIFKIIGAVVFAIVGLTIIFGSWYTVDQGEKAVILQNGATVGEAGPGLNFKMPWLQSVVTFDIRTQRSNTFDATIYSKDIQSAELKMSVNYRPDASRISEIYSKIGPNYFDRIIAPNILRITKEVSGKFTAADIVQTRDKLAEEITRELAAFVLPNGILIEQVQLENVDFSDAFEHSIEARMKAEVEVQQQKQVLEKQRIEADKVKIDADASAYSVQKAAEAQAYQVKQAAEAEAFRIRETMSAEAQGITKRGDALRANQNLVELVKAERWDGKLPTTMLPDGAVPMLSLR